LRELKTLNQQNVINMKNTEVIAVSAITKKQFHEIKGSELFDGFGNHSNFISPMFMTVEYIVEKPITLRILK
jgi:hypothetical protein